MSEKTCPKCQASVNGDAPHACPVPAVPDSPARSGPAVFEETRIDPKTAAPPAAKPEAKSSVKPPAAPEAQAEPKPIAKSPTPSAAVRSGAKSAAKPAPKVGAKPGDSNAPTVSKRSIDEPPTGIEEMLKDPEKVVNQYVLAQMLGKGGMGQVWKAWDTKLSRWVALKFLTLSDETNIKRFEREAKLAARLRHPNIAAVYEVGEQKGRHFIAMEFVDGTSLGKAGLTLRQAVEVIAKIARALEEAHKEGVIHRDLKPDNLMVTPSGRPYVMDFGLAKAVEAESSLSVSGDIMGTPLYMSPEQARGEVDQLDHRTDVYSLGATLYTLITGEKPFTGKTSMEILVKVVGQDPTPPRKIKPEIPEPIEAVVLKSMEKDRERRYPTALAFAEDLERFLGDQDVLAKLPSLSTLILRRVKRNAWPAALGFVVLLALALGAMVYATRGTAPASPDWISTFRNERRALEFRAWKPGDAALPSRVQGYLARLSAASSDETREAADWFRKEIELAENSVELWQSRPKGEWLKLRDVARHAVGWCDAAGGALAGLKGEFSALAGRLPPLKHSAEVMSAWRGEFTLRIATIPMGALTLRRGGQEVPLKDREAPLVIPDLEIDDYEIQLATSPEGNFTLALPAKRLRDGVTTTVVGDLRKTDTVKILP